VLDQALALHGRGPYVIQAAIAALHAGEARDWPQIAALYGELARLTDSPVVESNEVWVAVLGSEMLVRIDPDTNRITERVNVSGDPLAIATDGRGLFVTLNTDGLLLRLRETSRATRGSRRLAPSSALKMGLAG
jgi:hypothetical protein